MLQLSHLPGCNRLQELGLSNVTFKQITKLVNNPSFRQKILGLQKLHLSLTDDDYDFTEANLEALE